MEVQRKTPLTDDLVVNVKGELDVNRDIVDVRLVPCIKLKGPLRRTRYKI